jgi:hypothetical protein
MWMGLRTPTTSLCLACGPEGLAGVMHAKVPDDWHAGVRHLKACSAHVGCTITACTITPCTIPACCTITACHAASNCSLCPCLWPWLYCMQFIMRRVLVGMKQAIGHVKHAGLHFGTCLLFHCCLDCVIATACCHAA